MTAERSAQDWAAVLAGLDADLAKALAALELVEREREPLPLPAATGDKKALVRLAELDERRQALGRQRDMLQDALRAGRDRLATAQQAEAQAREAVRLERLREAALAQIGLAAEVDRAAQVLAQALRHFDAGLDAMAPHGLDPGIRRKLGNGTVRAGSMHVAGLSGLLPLPPVSTGHRATWEGWSRQMLATATGEAACPALTPVPSMLPRAPSGEPEDGELEALAEPDRRRPLIGGGAVAGVRREDAA
jgi:hypothetical protein